VSSCVTSVPLVESAAETERTPAIWTGAISRLARRSHLCFRRAKDTVSYLSSRRSIAGCPCGRQGADRPY